MSKKKITTTVTTTVYIHNYENLVIGSKDFRKKVASRTAELRNDTDHFSEWLSHTKGLSSGEVFNLTAEERAELWQEYEKQCSEDAEEELLENDWCENTVEVEVEIEVES